MKLVISQSLDNNKVRLDFKNGPSKPAKLPSYEIENSKADEFVREYNAQCEKLQTLANTLIGTGTLAGTFAGVKIYKSASSNKLVKGFSSAGLGLITGALASAITSSNMKNQLMDKYDVKTFSAKA